MTRYEHGRAGHCLASDPNARSCHHHHEHLLPASVDVAAQLAARYRPYTFSSDGEILDLFDKYGDYLLFEAPGGKGVFYSVGERLVPPHLLRTLVAIALGNTECQDWSQYQSDEPLRRSASFIRGL